MSDPARGQIYWADLNPVRGHEQGGRRPVLVISHDLFNARSGTVIAMAISSQPQRARYPLTYQLPDDLLKRVSWVKISQVRTLSTERLNGPIGRLPGDEVKEIVQGLAQLVG